jgi:RNA polymerase sigma-54 factor
LHNNQPCPSCANTLAGSPEQPIVYLSCHEDFFTKPRATSYLDDLPDDNFAPDKEALPAYILRQIGPELLIEDRPIAVHILTAIDEDGFLTIKPMEIALYHHVPLSRIEKLINLIQHADPVGVGSLTPKDALLIQLEVLSDTIKIPRLADKAILAGMELLSPHRIPDLARYLGISISETNEIVRFISDNLNPFPGRAHWGDQVNAGSSNGQENTFHFPDVIISRVNDSEDTPLVVEIAMPFYGSLRVNPLFREALHQAPTEKSELWQEDLEQATLLVKCLQQRNHTIVRLMQKLVVLQREFILWRCKSKTDAVLICRRIKRESTMSRAVSDKAVQLPNRRIVLCHFLRPILYTYALKQINQETYTL